MHSLIIPAWFSSDRSKSFGVFVVQHAKALASVGCKSGMIYVERSAQADQIHWQDDNVNVLVQQTSVPPKVGPLKRRWKKAYLDLYDRYVELHGRPDIIHAHGYIAGEAARFISRNKEIPYIVTEHTSTLITGVPDHQRAALRKTYRDAVKLLAVSEFLADAMSSYVPRNRIEIVHNPVSTEVFVPGHSDQSDEPLRVTAVGHADENKSFDVLIEAFASVLEKIANARLRIIGDGPQMARLKAIADSLGIAPQIEFMGRLPQHEIARQLGTSHLLVSSSKVETFGLTVLEAMSCGLPVVVTPSGGVTELVNESNGIICEGFRKEDIAEGILALVEQMNRFDRLSIREAVVRSFSLQVIGRKTLNVYKGVLATQNTVETP